MVTVKKMIDLSQPLYHNCPGWPTYKMVDVQYEAIYPVDGFTAERIELNVHTGTHLDTPFHFYPDGKTIEQYPVSTFSGNAIPIDLFGMAPDTAIGPEHLEPYAARLEPGDIIL